MCIFNSIDNIPDLSVGILSGSKTLLGGGEDVMFFCKAGESSGKETSPNFTKDISHCNRPVVTKILSGAFFVEKVCMTLCPGGGCVFVMPETL